MTGQKLLKVSVLALGFLRRGLIIADLSSLGILPDMSDKLTIFFKIKTSIGKHFHIIVVCRGSREQDFIVLFLIKSKMLLSSRGSNEDNVVEQCVLSS